MEKENLNFEEQKEREKAERINNCHEKAVNIRLSSTSGRWTNFGLHIDSIDIETLLEYKHLGAERAPKKITLKKGEQKLTSIALYENGDKIFCFFNETEGVQGHFVLSDVWVSRWDPMVKLDNQSSAVAMRIRNLAVIAEAMWKSYRDGGYV